MKRTTSKKKPVTGNEEESPYGDMNLEQAIQLVLDEGSKKTKRHDDVIEDIRTSSDPYAELLSSQKGPHSKGQLKRHPRDVYFAAPKKHGPRRIAFGSRLSGLVLEFYQAVVPVVRLYNALQPNCCRKKMFRQLGDVIGTARAFLMDNRWIRLGFKRMFEDLDLSMLEQIVGNVILLERKDLTDDQIVAWFMLHYRSEDDESPRLAMHASELFGEDDDEEEVGK